MNIIRRGPKNKYYWFIKYIDTAIECNVKRVVFLSTDKAVYPINAMGISKSMAEKFLYLNH